MPSEEEVMVKDEQWMKTIGVGRVSPSEVKEGHDALLLYNKPAMNAVMGFLVVCAKLGWRDFSMHTYIDGNGKRDRYRIIG